MKKAKKFIAILTAAAMAMLPMSTAFAAGDQTDLTGSSIDSDATVDYIDASQVLKITVPTSASMGFTLDPQNLAATKGVGDWTPGDGGTILPQAVVTFVNRSAVPIKTIINFGVADNATKKTTLVASDSDINTGTDKLMHLTVTPSTKKTSVSGAAIVATAAPVFYQESGDDVVYTSDELTAAGVKAANIKTLSASGTAVFADYVATDGTDKTYKQVVVPIIASDVAATKDTTVTEYNATAPNGFADTAHVASVSGAGISVGYVIGKAGYYVSKSTGSYALVYRDGESNTNYDTASFIIGGSINKFADWSGYTGSTTIKLTATYTFEAMTDTQASDLLSTSKLTGSHNSIDTTPATAPSIASGDLTKALTAATAVDVPVDLGTGSLKATGITSIAYNGSNIATSNYDFANGKITFKASYVDSLIDASFTTGTFKVTFNNGSTATAVDLTLTYTAPIAPSIASGDLTKALTAATAVDVPVDLGAGSLAATGITSIAYNGSDLSATNDYSFANGKITFKAAYVDTLIGTSGFTTGTFKVTFNNGSTATAVDLTLTYTSPNTPASVTTKNVSFSKTTGASITVNLGSGTGKATSITSVIVVNNGEYPMAAGTYDLTGTTLKLHADCLISALGTGLTRTIKVTFNTGVSDTFVATATGQ